MQDKKPLTLTVSPQLLESIGAYYDTQKSDHLIMSGGRSQGKTHLINQIRKGKKREIKPQKEEFSNYLFMNIYKGEDIEEAKKLTAEKQHKKFLATCAKNRKKRKSKKRK